MPVFVTKLFVVALLFFSLTVLSLITGAEDIVRSILAFGLVPLWFFYANRRHLWFRQKLRWLMEMTHKPIISTAIFVLCVLISHEALVLPFGTFGLLFHYLLLLFGAVVYWAPFLISCSFVKKRSYIQLFSYFTLTTLLFFVYHQVIYVYFPSELVFLVTGLVTMVLTLFVLHFNWARSEEGIDRSTVRGYVEAVDRKEKP